MGQPLAFFVTWTTFGTWLPGDARGWVKSGEPGIQHSDPALEGLKRQIIRQSPVVLSADQRKLVESVIRRHCIIRAWEIHALNVRTNHVHIVVSAEEGPERVMAQLKAWCSRHLNETHGACGQDGGRRKWWTEHGSTRWIKNEKGLRAAIEYVLDRQ